MLDVMIIPILVIENKQIINTLNGCGGISYYIPVTSIIFDQSGYMAKGCVNNNNILYLYNNNLSLTGINKSAADFPHSIEFDSKGRFIVLSNSQISLYY